MNHHLRGLRQGHLALLLSLWLALAGCAGTGTQPIKTAADSPEPTWQPLLADAALHHVYEDGKTLVDMIPERPMPAILADYRALPCQPDCNTGEISAFMQQNFREPPTPDERLSEPENTPVVQHIRNLWPVLTRSPEDSRQGPLSTMVALPHRYVVPGGRFNEMFYWDSYFTMLGLAANDRYDLVRDMVANFAWLIDTYGFIPNGTRTYFLSRSQPPFFAAMVNLLAEHDGDEVYTRYLPQLEQEYEFWMRGADRLAPGQAGERVVRLPDGTLLNRYFGGENRPRPEAYAAEIETAAQSDRPAPVVYGNLRAAAESGWDFSSRWMADGEHLATLETRDILPVDLNSLMANLENTLAQAWQVAGNRERAAHYRDRVQVRQQALNTVFWSAQGFYSDYAWSRQAPTGRLTAATSFPLFLGLATPSHADGVAQAIQTRLLKPGGIVTTPRNTGEQWDAPNGWAPLQWAAIRGLRRYGHEALAERIARRWIDTNVSVYRRTGKLVEKYNVVSPGVGGGGEYDVVDGFGWTNGVLMQLLELYPQAAEGRRSQPAVMETSP
ncbi:alpha,alpha-trehalase [Kushneria sinocarnis]|uniref:Alpha,alpha-trehalase n=1 Tax=Kushneria sinocarnis TaxID=595502 RepID=A0A420X118_9GAMM|nr:alpha,alpha-trehalase TreA [Kushneria sinocarnis]RKR07399.1 alpha,alpha-trehalase [Kushneria sinocarnis]